MGTKVFFKNPVPDGKLPESVKALVQTLPKAQLDFWHAHRDHVGVRIEKGRVSCRTCNVASKG